MKKINLSVLFLLISIAGFAQINTPVVPSANIAGENSFLDLSEYSVGAPMGYDNNEAKGLVFPSTNLTQWVFKTENLGVIFPTAFDGMVVFNTGVGSTGSNPATQGVQVTVAPGFYYFSNPNGAANGNITDGVWKPIGGESASIKSKTVTVTVTGTPTSATLDLGTSTITANEVTSFLGAKIYDSTGNNLIMKADSDYNKTTNVLTTGNGIMYQVLPAGTYKVVVDYR